MFRKNILLFSIIMLCSCDGDDSRNDILEKININKSKWKDSGVETYSYIYSNILTDCPVANILPPLVISVEAGSVVSVYNPVLGTFDSDFDRWYTIDQIFENMVVYASQDYVHFSKSQSELGEDPEFNTEYGYPVSFYVDASDAECDAQSVTVSEFQ